MAFVVRDATEADAPKIVEFQLAMAKETEGIELDRETCTRGVAAVFSDATLGRYFVAAQDGVVVGSLMITYEWSDWRNGVFWWIQSVYVRPEFRGKGIYRALHAHVRTMAKAAGGVCGFRLYVEKENAAAQETYRRLGMHETPYVLFEEP